MKKIIITPADKFEIDFVVDYVLKCNFKTYTETQFEKTKMRYLKRLRSKSYLCFVAMIDARIVGYVDLDVRKSDCSSTIWINEIYVLNKFRHLKIATSLIKHAERSAKDLGFDSTYLNIEPENTACLGLIGKNGYKCVQYILRKKI